MSNFRWIIDNPNDTIQQFLRRNEFFQVDELDYMKRFITNDTILLDIGANVGNHAVYFSKCTSAKKIYVIEPIPRTYQLLLANIALNYCHNVNVDHIGLAFGDRECLGYPFMVYGKDNLGATGLNPVPVRDIEGIDPELVLAPVKVIIGDSIFKDIHIDFIKIDVEGMEMVTLAGLEETIQNSRPIMFIEVMTANDEEFKQWCTNLGYIIESKHDILTQGIFANYLIIPETR